MKVERGQVWKHKASGDIRTVVAVVPYEHRVGKPPRDQDAKHIAVMTPNPNDRRDSSDMEIGSDGGPLYRSSWEHMTVQPASDT